MNTCAEGRLGRRDFLKGALAASAASLLPTATWAGDSDWKTLFRTLGFDPEADGSSCFVITSDCHVLQPLGKGKSNHDFLASHVEAWNALRPKPAFLGVLGDIANLNEFFGHRPGPAYAAQQAAEGYGLFNRLVTARLDPEIRRVYVIGNHDTYPGEDDRALWRKHFPDQPPYCAYDLCGMHVLKWDGGGDAVFSSAQEAWIRVACAKVPKDKPLTILVHQPAVGLCGRERDIGRLAKECLKGRTGPTWLLAGHEHSNRLTRWDLEGGGTLAVATHAKDHKGWWLYGVRHGTIVARLFCASETSAWSHAKMPSEIESCGPIPIAWEGRTDVVWKAFVGSQEERRFRVKTANTGDNGGWFYYVGTLTYRFPKAQLAPKATKFAILGEMPGKRGSWTPSPCYASADAKTWTRLERSKPKCDVYEYALPPELVGVPELYVEYDGYGMDCDDCVAGFAFLA